MSTDELVAAFEAGTIDGGAFPHEAHVRVTWALAHGYGRDDALRRIADGIRGMAARAGRPGVYHETITRAWFELISAAGDLGEHPELFDKALIGRYYSPEALAAGRQRWVEPDLAPLELPAPAGGGGRGPARSGEPPPSGPRLCFLRQSPARSGRLA